MQPDGSTVSPTAEPSSSRPRLVRRRVPSVPTVSTANEGLRLKVAPKRWVTSQLASVSYWRPIRLRPSNGTEAILLPLTTHGWGRGRCGGGGYDPSAGCRTTSEDFKSLADNLILSVADAEMTKTDHHHPGHIHPRPSPPDPGSYHEHAIECDVPYPVPPPPQSSPVQMALTYT